MKSIKEFDFVKTILSFPNRIITLIWKMMSIKFVGLAFVMWAIYDGKVQDWYAVILFLFTFLIVVFGREALKWIEALKGLK